METSAAKTLDRSCAFCLTSISAKNVKCCARCKRRAYCSRDCQAADWSTGTSSQVHKNWCKLNCGEEDLDWKVTKIQGKGFGLIAARLIPAKSRIMVDAVRSESHPGVKDLMPVTGSTREKVNLNGLDDGEGRTVICLRIARANHNCNSNADHYYDATFKVKVLFALRDIQDGEEICINYQPVNDISNVTTGSQVRATLQNKWGIVCPENCFCRNINMEKLVTRGRQLDSSIILKGSSGRVADALEDVDKLMELHEAIESSYISKMRTLYDGFQVGIMQKRTLRKADGYITKAYDILVNILLSPKSEEAMEFEAFMKNPASHPNYLTQ